MLPAIEINNMPQEVVEVNLGYGYILKVNSSYVDNLMNFKKIPFNIILERAAKNDKEIIGFHGVNNDCDKIWGVRCLKCGEESRKLLRFFYKCRGCDIIRKTYTNDFFVKTSSKLHNNKYIYEDEYTNSNIKMKIYCTLCKKYFFQKPKYHLSGTGCPRCKISKGERLIESYLISRNIEYIWHHKFDTLRYINLLEVDFYLPGFNRIIEYNGEQHYSLEFYLNKKIPNPEKAFSDCKKRDFKKILWCKENNVGISIIPHWDIKFIEDILDETLGFKNAAK